MWCFGLTGRIVALAINATNKMTAIKYIVVL
jgi:hypothetical protein